MHGELVAQHRVIDLAEHDERLVDRLQRCERPVGGDLDDGQHVVRVGVSPSSGKLLRNADRLRAVVPALFEPADAAQGDREVAVRGHRRRRAGLRARECGRVVPGRRSRVRQAHREMAQGHRDGSPPGHVIEALGDVLREAKRVRRAGQAIELDLELRLGDVQIELLAKAGALGRGPERPRGHSQLGLGVVGSPVDRGEVRSLDRQPRGVERSPRCRGARERRRELARAIDPSSLAVTAEQAHGERRIRAVPSRQDALDPRGDEGGLVARCEAVEQLRTCGDRHDVAVRAVGKRGRRNERRASGSKPEAGGGARGAMEPTDGRGATDGDVAGGGTTLPL